MVHVSGRWTDQTTLKNDLTGIYSIDLYQADSFKEVDQ